MATLKFINPSSAAGITSCTLVLDDPTAEDFLLLLSAQFAEILIKAKAELAIDTATSEFMPELTGNRTIMIQIAKLSGAHGQPETPIVIDFHILKLRAKSDLNRSIGAESALYTFNRLLALLKANGNFNGLGGLIRLDSFDSSIGPEYTSQFDTEHGDQLDGALLTVTYAIALPYSISLI